MRRKRWILPAGLVLATLGIMFGTRWWLGRPWYQGKPLSVWLEDYEVIPMLVQELSDSRAGFRNTALITLSQMQDVPDLVIPARRQETEKSGTGINLDFCHGQSDDQATTLR